MASHTSTPARATLWSYIESRADSEPDRVFAYFDDDPTTMAQLRAHVNSAANSLLGFGLGAGDRLAMFTTNCAEFVDVLLAATRIGVLSVPVNTMFYGDFLVHQLNDAGVKAILVDEQLLERVLEISDRLSSLQIVFVRSAEPDAEIAGSRLRIIPAGRLYDGGTDAVVGGTELGWKDPSGILYTSGTTGPSKGVVVTQNYLVSAAKALGRAYEITSGDVVFGAMPLFHFGGMVAVLITALVNGATCVIDSAFSATKCWDRVRTRGATVFMGVGPMVMMLYGLPRTEAESNLSLRLICAAPIPAESHQAIEERYGCPVRTVYALTEAFPLFLQPLRAPVIPGSSGHPNPEFDIVLVDDDDVPVPVGQVGEVACRPRAPHMMYEGYFGLPEVSHAQSRNLWFHTGDSGRLDPDGNFTFVDRQKDAIRRRGENISSFEIEQVVVRHPAVAECAAIGVASELGDQEVKICVVLAADQEVEPDSIVDYCAENLPRFAVPRYVEFVSLLPKTATGRVQKTKLRQEPLGPATWDRAAVTQSVATGASQ